MRRKALYSRVNRTADRSPVASSDVAYSKTDASSSSFSRLARFRLLMASRLSIGSALAGIVALCLLAAFFSTLNPAPYRLTQKDIDKAVLHTLRNTTLPSPAVKAYKTILPSIVQVTSYRKTRDGKKEVERSVGTGVVIVDKGIILTNLHVVQGADRMQLTFADGLESSASVIGMRPEHDLAVLQAHTIPDDLIAATMRSTEELSPGDHVFAVGFPFGIGPSVTAGVVSGLNREYLSPEGKRVLTNLIQFDAAVNPGNSGGPLITAEGEVGGIVTAIFNPTEQRVFIGIGFAVPIENAASAAGMPPF
jgi:S1-C subfamily serine protease